MAVIKYLEEQNISLQRANLTVAGISPIGEILDRQSGEEIDARIVSSGAPAAEELQRIEPLDLCS